MLCPWDKVVAAAVAQEGKINHTQGQPIVVAVVEDMLKIEVGTSRYTATHRSGDLRSGDVLARCYFRLCGM